MTRPDLAATRTALHAVAELVLAGPQHRAHGTIKLRVSPGGFRTWTEPAIAVVGTYVVAGDTAVSISGRTSRQLAAAIGVEPGAPLDLYADGGGLRVDDELVLDPDAAAFIAESYARGDAALRSLAPHLEPVLWPEHFDVGIRVDDVNYGVSPGDGYLAEPYAYAGVDPVPAGDPFWNAPFGAARSMTAFADGPALHRFFVEASQRSR